jgi:hypothetical protein
MLTLNAQTGLATGQLIQVIVAAKNINGWGSYSQPNIIGQKVETLPQ